MYNLKVLENIEIHALPLKVWDQSDKKKKTFYSAKMH